MFVGPIPVAWCSFYIFLFFCFLQPPIPKLTEPRGKKKKNLETQTHRTQWKKKKKKKKMKKTKPDPTWKGKEEKKKKKKKKNPNSPNLVEKKKVATGLWPWDPQCRFNYGNAIENWVM